MSSHDSCAQALADPMTVVKVLVPSVAIEAVVHHQVWKYASTRTLTLGLALLNTYWFATSFNMTALVSPLYIKCKNDASKLEETKECSRHHFNLLNKLEIPLAVLGLDLFLEWRQRLVAKNTLLDNCLVAAVSAPLIITALQSGVILPKMNKKAKEPAAQGDVCQKPACCYFGFEAVKFAGLAVAGLRFGNMLTK
ncbi:hypothetical protein K501DRAFT_327873 [Backusella circina FSU 941]|nr:hypothetical protein K501DRAFT_327873 [Backusella circina FSU 941]